MRQARKASILSVESDAIAFDQNGAVTRLKRDKDKDDIVEKNDGQSVKGRLEKVTASEVVINSGVAPLRYPRSEVKMISARILVSDPLKKARGARRGGSAP